jgi:hypothetical protein
MRAWRRDFVYVTLLAGVVQLPVLAMQLAVFGDDGVRVTTNDTTERWAVALVVLLAITIVHHFLAGMLEELESSRRRGHPAPTVRSLIQKLPWARLIVADVVISLAMVVGLFAFVVPGLVIASVFSLTMPLLNMEREPVMATLKRSYRLARPHLGTVTMVWVAAQLLVATGTEIVASVIHLFGHAPLVNLLGHLVPEALLLPLGALPPVMITFMLIDAERAGAQGRESWKANH